MKQLILCSDAEKKGKRKFWSERKKILKLQSSVFFATKQKVFI